MLGKLAHYAVDVVLVSTVLAGIKRSTDLTVATGKIESPDVRSAVDKFLTVGDWVIDQSILVMTASQYFERKRSEGGRSN